MGHDTSSLLPESAILVAAVAAVAGLPVSFYARFPHMEPLVPISFGFFRIG